MQKIFFPAMMFLIFLFGSCNQSKRSSASVSGNAANIGSELLYQHEWKLISLNNQPVPASSIAMLAFTPGQVTKVTGYTGCNRTNGSFELNGTSGIRFQSLATTRMACPDAIGNDLEATFLAALNAADYWSINGEVLTLKKGDKVVAVFIAKPANATINPLLNGIWKLSFMSETNTALEALFPSEKPTLIFNLLQSEINGNGGCNAYSAKIIIDSTNLSIADPLSTLMACEGKGEPVFFKTLKSVTGYRINAGELILLAEKLPVLKFQKK